MYCLTQDTSKHSHPSEVAHVLHLGFNGWARHSSPHMTIYYNTTGSAHPLMTFQLTLTFPCSALQVLWYASGRHLSDEHSTCSYGGIVASCWGMPMALLAPGYVTYLILCTTRSMGPLAENPGRRIGWKHYCSPPQTHPLWRLRGGRDGRHHPHACYVASSTQVKRHVSLELRQQTCLRGV